MAGAAGRAAAAHCTPEHPQVRYQKYGSEHLAQGEPGPGAEAA